MNCMCLGGQWAKGESISNSQLLYATEEADGPHRLGLFPIEIGTYAVCNSMPKGYLRVITCQVSES